MARRSLAQLAESLRVRMERRQGFEMNINPPAGAAGTGDLAELARIVTETAELAQTLKLRIDALTQKEARNGR